MGGIDDLAYIILDLDQFLHDRGVVQLDWFDRPWFFADYETDRRRNRLVCISRDIPEEDIALTLPALNTPAGTQAIYSMQDLRERHARQ